MNGGAELYLEYGFDRMVVTELTFEEFNFKIGIYHMGGVKAAFGIYSVSVFRCRKRNSFSDYSCQTAYQLQICGGEYYINIINNTGSTDEVNISEMFAGRILRQIEGGSFDITDYLQGIEPSGIPERYVLFKGDLGLYNGAFGWYDFLKEVTVYTDLLTESEDVAILCLRFESRRAHWLRTSPRFLRATSDEVAELVNSVPRCLQRGASITGRPGKVPL